MPGAYWHDKISALNKRLTDFAVKEPEAIGSHEDLLAYLGDLGVTQMLATAIRCTGTRILHGPGLAAIIDESPAFRTDYDGPQLALHRTHRSILEGKSYHTEANVPIIGADCRVNSNLALPEGAFNAEVADIGAPRSHAVYHSGIEVSESNDPNTLLTVVRDVALGISFELGSHGIINEKATSVHVAAMPMELFTGTAGRDS